MAGCIHWCGAVADCNEPKQVIVEKNTYHPQEFGKEKYTPQCKTCGRCGPSSRKKPEGISVLVTRDEANKLKKTREEEQKQRAENERKEREEAIKKGERDWWNRYNEYLKSDEWLVKRRQVLARDEVCAGCMCAVSTEVHHKSYAHVGNEFLFELVGLCHDCHQRFHSEGIKLYTSIDGYIFASNEENRTI